MTRSRLISVLAACFAILFTACLARAAGFSYISKEQLKSELTNPDITILDVRTPQDWDSSQWKIQGAQRQSPMDANQWMNRFAKDRTLVLYCA